MPRDARIDAPGALHHVIARGIERRKIFRTRKDYLDFLTRLAGLVTETKTDCYAWALLPNHFHLLLKTGKVPIATVMRRLLTGYAVSFNHRHQRHGHVFQNRYKSILCQEDAYLLELVRYIHLNALRAGLVADLKALAGFAYTGHGAITGDQPNDWQNTGAVLRMFSEKPQLARQRYGEFVEEGMKQGRRQELTGGGLIRSLGGWAAVKDAGKPREYHKSDERILGDSDFVSSTLEQVQEACIKRHFLRAQGIGFEQLLEAVARSACISPGSVMTAGKERQQVKARSVLCYWAVRELGMTMTAVARKIGMSVPAVAMSVKRGAIIAGENGYLLPGAEKV